MVFAVVEMRSNPPRSAMTDTIYLHHHRADLAVLQPWWKTISASFQETCGKARPADNAPGMSWVRGTVEPAYAEEGGATA